MIAQIDVLSKERFVVELTTPEWALLAHGVFNRANLEWVPPIKSGDTSVTVGAIDVPDLMAKLRRALRLLSAHFDEVSVCFTDRALRDGALAAL